MTNTTIVLFYCDFPHILSCCFPCSFMSSYTCSSIFTHCWDSRFTLHLGLQAKFQKTRGLNAAAASHIGKVISQSFSFYRATACDATHSFTVAILSVCPSVCQTRVLWQNKIIVCQYLNTIRKRDISRMSTPTEVAANCPLPPEIFAESDPPLRKTPTSTDFRL